MLARLSCLEMLAVSMKESRKGNVAYKKGFYMMCTVLPVGAGHPATVDFADITVQENSSLGS